MRENLYLLSALTLCALVSGCELLCQAGTGTCGMSREQANKYLHGNPYGKDWTKAGMTTESWRDDWTGCGGFASGHYGADTPPGSTTAVIRAASEKVRLNLVACMQAKGYVYRYTGP